MAGDLPQRHVQGLRLFSGHRGSLKLERGRFIWPSTVGHDPADHSVTITAARLSAYRESRRAGSAIAEGCCSVSALSPGEKSWVAGEAACLEDGGVNSLIKTQE
jgi:hypothetical protein